MKYISEFRGFDRNYLRDCGDSNEFFHILRNSATVVNTETGLAEAFFSKGQDTLGVGYDKVNSQYVAVCHTPKTALLHKYVDVCTRRRGNLRGGFVTFGHRSTLTHDGDTCINVMFSFELLSICGLNGSVVCFSSRNFAADDLYMTLYDFMLYVCRATKLNLMRYSVVKFNIGLLNKSIIIKLSNSKEAKRFFTKMWIDACTKEG